MRIEETRIERGLSKSDIWKAAGLSSGAYTHWMNGSALKGENLIKVAKALGVTPTWLETGKGEKLAKKSKVGEVEIDENSDYAAIMRVEFKLAAGISGYSIEYLAGERSPILLPKRFLERRGYVAEKLFSVHVAGRSMEPNLYEDDLVVVNTADTKLLDGEVYAVNYEGELGIKRLIRESGQWYLSSDNPDKSRYANKLCHEDCFIIGRIVHKQSERI